MKRIIYRVNDEDPTRTIVYEKINKGKMKYQLVEGISCDTGIRVKKTLIAGRIKLKTTGRLYLLYAYPWNGSNLVPDTDEDMRGSAFHDALSVLMKIGLLSRHYQVKVNDLYEKHCREDGMSPWRNKLRRAGLKFYWLRIRRIMKNVEFPIMVEKAVIMKKVAGVLAKDLVERSEEAKHTANSWKDDQIPKEESEDV